MHKKICCFVIYFFLTFISLSIHAQTSPAASNNAGVKVSESISANPAAVNIVTGNANLQNFIEKKLGIKNNHGIRFGGAWVGDANDLFAGGIPNPDRWTTNSLLLLNLSIDTEKFAGWKGGLFGVEFLQFNGQSTNKQAGTVQGYNSLPGAPPLNRSQLYQLWFRQKLFQDKLIARIGKLVPTDDFGNVIRPVPLSQENLFIPAVTGLIYTPIFVNTSMLGAMPGYYNSAYGLTLSFVPIKQLYFLYGLFDGALAQGTQTGLTGPVFDDSYFQIGEVGGSWLLGKNQLPGNVGVGLWQQTGTVNNGSLSENGTTGYYLFGSQRLWYKDPYEDNSGISAFYQFGTNASHVLTMTKYVGGGFTGFGLVPKRPNDSIGVGAAYSWLNQTIFTQPNELMLQTYYQAQIAKSIYLEPVLSYVPNPGAMPNLKAAWAGTLRAVVLF